MYGNLNQSKEKLEESKTLSKKYHSLSFNQETGEKIAKRLIQCR